MRETLGGTFPSGSLPPNPKFEEPARLGTRVDGRDLIGADLVSASTAWIARTCHQLSGREYTQFLRLYAGALPTRVRTTRGIGRRPPGATLCRRGCGAEETAAHVVNHCPRVRGGVILRHHSVVKLLVDSFQRLGYRCFMERTLTRGTSVCRPDLIVNAGDQLIILDVSIVGGRIDTERVSDAKVSKYAKDWIYRAAAEVVAAPTSRRRVIAVTLHWKGLWSKKSAEQLMELGVSTRALGWMTQRVLRGSHMNYSAWRRGAVALDRPP